MHAHYAKWYYGDFPFYRMDVFCTSGDMAVHPFWRRGMIVRTLCITVQPFCEMVAFGTLVKLFNYHFAERCNHSAERSTILQNGSQTRPLCIMVAHYARTREDTSGNNGSLGLGGGSLSAVIPGSHEAPRPLARSLDPSKPHSTAMGGLAAHAG